MRDMTEFIRSRTAARMQTTAVSGLIFSEAPLAAAVKNRLLNQVEAGGEARRSRWRRSDTSH